LTEPMRDIIFSKPDVRLEENKISGYSVNRRESIFMSMGEAVEAVCIDFRRYEPQIVLLCQVIQLVLGDTVVVKREGRKPGAWISTGPRPHMKWAQGWELVDIASAAVRDTEEDPGLLASVCTRVFHERAWVEGDPETGQQGIRIATGMEGFSCKQCGRCCRSLDYHDDLTREDVRRWEKLGRTDILRWVRVIEERGGKGIYKIWTIPGTTQLAEVCPFLKEVSSENRWACLIHDVKPAICRQYPLTRKHGLMTGCPGLERTKRSQLIRRF
jgi:Fe-S-cluster containining protein